VTAAEKESRFKGRASYYILTIYKATQFYYVEEHAPIKCSQ